MQRDFALTPRGAPHKISPESSDGFASVGTILPEKSCPVAGRLFSLVFASESVQPGWLLLLFAARVKAAMSFR